MSLAKVSEINDYFINKYGDGIEEITVSEDIFNALLTDITVQRSLDHIPIQDREGNPATNIKFHTHHGYSVIITRSKKEEIEKTERQIKELQEKLDKLKTRTGY